MKIIACCALVLSLSACAIEGIGFDGRVNAYQGAESDSREYTALHIGQRDAAWYAGWCDTLRPHFQRMSDELARVNRYCSAMQAQPENAQKIGQALTDELTRGRDGVQANRSAVLGGLAAYSQAQQAARPAQQVQYISTPSVSPTVNCSSYTLGNQVNTTCR